MDYEPYGKALTHHLSAERHLLFFWGGWGGERQKFSLHQISPRTFHLSEFSSIKVSVLGRHVLWSSPSLLPPIGVNVTMPSQPGMPPLSSTQLQIDPAVEEFQLVDLSRRFLVHDSFWALPEQFLGNKVRGQAATLDRERAEPLPTCSEPACALLPLKVVGSRVASAVGKGMVVPQRGPLWAAAHSSCPPLLSWEEC